MSLRGSALTILRLSVPPSCNSSAPTPCHATVMKNGSPCPLAPRRRCSAEFFRELSPLPEPDSIAWMFSIRPIFSCLRACPPGAMARCCLVYVSLRVLPHRTDRSRLLTQQNRSTTLLLILDSLSPAHWRTLADDRRNWVAAHMVPAAHVFAVGVVGLEPARSRKYSTRARWILWSRKLRGCVFSWHYGALDLERVAA
ncbi:hypothetical protein DFH06DRAFT_185391 [Mycena polygramma]|nr:hypothetical protein DFH06DRAFT_185391 [Mycena polygramma]